jgi:N-acetylglucosaminyl-diphospho-decaprenol L-rhamnosyltransferase
LNDVSLLVVNYRTARFAADAITSARRTSSRPLHVVVVDNSGDSDELRALAGSGADEVLAAPRNLGYGAGINWGRARCSGSVLIVSNPDVIFHDGAVDGLVDAAAGGAAVAGPLFVWDDDGRWLLPPAEHPTLFSKGEEVIASRSRAAARILARRRLRNRLEFWDDRSRRGVAALSGAVLCMPATVFDRLEGFDERFFLYFEETDFVRRASAHGRIEYVPGAVCRHLFSQSAALSPDSFDRWRESELHFFRKWYGRRGEVLMAMGGGPPSPQEPAARRSDGWVVNVPQDHSGRVVVEASPLADFVSAVGHFPTSGMVTLPPEVVASYRGSELFVRVVDRGSLEVLDTVRFVNNG